MGSGIGFCRNEVCDWRLSEVGDMVSDRGLRVSGDWQILSILFFKEYFRMLV